MPSNLDVTLRTTFVVHGWLDTDDFRFTQIKDELLELYGGAVILVNWAGGALNVNYFQAAADTNTIGKEISIIMTILMNKYSMDRSLFWCVGHSLGGQTCGRAGNFVKLARIIALDPAGPDFEQRAAEGRVNRNSADWVEVIHTASTGLAAVKLGMFQPGGHADFYPNGGGNQPECQLIALLNGEPPGGLIGHGWLLNEGIVDTLTDDLVTKCSHFTSIRLFIESLRSQTCVARQKCSSHMFLPVFCALPTLTPLQVLGHSAEYQTQGVFYLSTNDHPLYCKG